MNEIGAINTCNISKFFGDFNALKDLTISVPQGEIYGFIGKNGAGKTTFMRIICGLMKPSSGTLEVKKQVSFLPQNVRFRDNMEGGAVLRYFAELKGCDVGEYKKTSIAVLVIIIIAAIIIGLVLVNKGDGPVTGMILADSKIENKDAYYNAVETHGGGVYLVVSNAFNKFQEDYKVEIPSGEDLYATIHLVECPKGSEFIGKWIKDGNVIGEDKGIVTTGPEGVISYMLEGEKVVKGSYIFELYDGDRKIFERTFSVE